MNVLYVDDEKPAIDNFRFTTADFPEITNLYTYQSGEEALKFAKEHVIDVAFLDMEMPGIHGLELAKALKEYDSQIRIIFVTAFSQYALEAWNVDATGYVMKPYTAREIHKELAKCMYRSLPSHRVKIETIPNFHVTVDGSPLYISGSKPREMFAFLVNCGERGFTMGECIACLWPDRPADAGTQSLCRMTWKRLVDTLESMGVGDIVTTSDNRRHLKVEQVECDLYRILEGDRQTARRYNGEYLQEYPWAEERNAQLYRVLRDMDQDFM